MTATLRLIVIMSLLIWVGTSISANMIAAPAKFQVADLTRSMALQVGRAQFLWVGYFELVLAATALISFATECSRVRVMVCLAVALFVIQRFVVLPQLSGLTDQVVSGETTGGSKLHLIFIGLEVVKILALVVAATMALFPLTRKTGKI